MIRSLPEKINTVCIIDDDPICVYGTKVLLNYNNIIGSDILVYEDGYEALTDLSSIALTGGNLPEVIFLDLNMPRMNGWAFLDEFSKLVIEQPPKIYIVSSFFTGNEIERGKNYTAVHDFIAKPLNENKVAEILASRIT